VVERDAHGVSALLELIASATDYIGLHAMYRRL
jgi:hypothetical protein